MRAFFTSLATALLIFVFVTCVVACLPKFAPPSIERGDPIAFPLTFNPKPWIEKTRPEKVSVWFRIDEAKKEWWMNLDAERLPFDTIVIHHSDTNSNASPEEIEAIHIETLYKPRYRMEVDDPYLFNLPLHSGHIVNGKETFIGYHYLVYPDGRIITTLSPLIKIDDKWYIDHVAWHAGNWKANCRSIAICLLGNFNNVQPTERQITAVRALVRYYYNFNPALTVEPHKKFNPRKDCPGFTWDQWKEKIQ